MVANCPRCKLGRKYISDNREFPRLIENGLTIIPNQHRFYTITVIECSNCNSLWLFRGEPASENNPAQGFYYPIDKQAFNNLDNVSFNEFIDFCISEFHNYKVGKFIEEKTEKFIKNDKSNVLHILNTQREIPSFLMDYLQEWYENNSE